MLLNNHVKQSPIIGLAGMGGGIASYVFLSADGAYEIARSLRFDSSSSAYLNKTPTAGNRKTWTWSAWIKRSSLGASKALFESRTGTSDTTIMQLSFNASDQLQVVNYSYFPLISSSVYRDPSAWYHVVWHLDTTQSTASDKMKLYVNGVEVTAFGTDNRSTLGANDQAINQAAAHYLGAEGGTTNYFDGYLADIWFVDGQALEPTSFGEFDADTGVWNPKRYTGAKSGNSFHLPFSDTTSTTTLGYDDSGNSNNWTLTNFLLTEGNGRYLGGTSSGNITTPENAFDGDLTTYASAFPAGTSGSYTLPTSKSVSSGIRINTLAGSGTGHPGGSYVALTVNGTTTTVNASAGWSSTLNLGSPLESITISAASGWGSPGLTAIEVDGVVLIDYIYGANNDSLLDSPSNDTDTGTGIGGEIVGNYATFNPLAIDNRGGSAGGQTLNGNLVAKATNTSEVNIPLSIRIPASGKYYLEINCDSTQRDPRIFIYPGFDMDAGGRLDAIGASAIAGSLYGFAFDRDSNVLYTYRNNTLIQTLTTMDASKSYALSVYDYDGTGWQYTLNAGQRDFAYDAPTGYKALNTAALPTPAIEVPSNYVGITTGNFDTTKTWVTGFQPDLIWFKSRGNSDGHMIQDSVRGVGSTGKYFFIGTGAEGTFPQGGQHGVTTFNSDGWTHASYGPISNGSMVAWTWKAGGNSNTFNVDGTGYSTASAAGLTAGDITPTGASVNTESGFSIITWTGTSASGTVPHGLGIKPSFIIGRRRNGVANWCVYHISTGASQGLNLQSTAAAFANTTRFGGVEPTSTVFSVGSSGDLNAGDALAYCWTEIPGFSKFGSYTGNGSQNFVQLGFRPALVMVKRAVVNSSPDATDNYSSWTIMDFKRLSYNGLTPNHLFANKSINEGYRGNASNTANLTDMTLEPVSNGFYLNGPGTEINANTGTYIYAAWAETPFSTQARAR